MTDKIVVLSACASPAEAEGIARALVEKRLAACVNVLPAMRSVYRWKDAVENEQEVFTAMIALKQHKGSFADAVILALGAKAGCPYTLTFDQKACRLAGFRLP